MRGEMFNPKEKMEQVCDELADKVLIAHHDAEKYLVIYKDEGKIWAEGASRGFSFRVDDVQEPICYKDFEPFVPWVRNFTATLPKEG